MLTVEVPQDPLAPLPRDLPTHVPLDGPLDSLDGAKILAAPDDPAEWPAWRAALARWRDEARQRVQHDGTAYERAELRWTQRCFACALVWLWDELLYDHDAQRFTPERLLDEAEREFGGYDGLVLWHAYPVIGIDERNQFDYYREVPGIRELVAAIKARGCACSSTTTRGTPGRGASRSPMPRPSPRSCGGSRQTESFSTR